MLKDKATKKADALQHKNALNLSELISNRILLTEKKYEERINKKNKEIKKLEEAIQKYHYITLGIVFVTGLVFAIKVL